MPQEICPYPWCSLYQSIPQKSDTITAGMYYLFSILCRLNIIISNCCSRPTSALPLIDLNPFIARKVLQLLKELYILYPGIVQGWLYYREECYKWLVTTLAKKPISMMALLVFYRHLHDCVVEMFTGISLYRYIRLQAVPLFSFLKQENKHRKIGNGTHKH